MTTLPELSHKQLWTWFEQNLPEEKRANQELGVLKAALLDRGLNSRGWRLYLDYGDSIFENLGKPWVAEDWIYTSGHNAVAFLCLLQGCEMDVLPPTALVRSMPTWHIPRNRLCYVPPGFFRAAWKMCIVGEYTGTPIDTLIESRIVPVCQWYFDTKQHDKPDSNLLKAGWAALEKRYLESLPACLSNGPEQDSKKGRNAGWITPILKAELDQFRFIALRNSSALEEEGLKMHHCIATYSDRCESSTLRAFSVRQQKTDERIATLTVFYSPQSRSWQLDQIHGPSNTEVNERVIESSLGLLQCLDESTRSDRSMQATLGQLGLVRELARRPRASYEGCLRF